MKNRMIYALVGIGLLAGVARAYAEPITLGYLQRIAGRFSYFFIIEQTADEPLRYIYADTRQHVHLYNVTDKRAVLEWESVELGSRASAR